jgi:hypothetical protein
MVLSTVSSCLQVLSVPPRLPLIIEAFFVAQNLIFSHKPRPPNVLREDELELVVFTPHFSLRNVLEFMIVLLMAFTPIEADSV